MLPTVRINFVAIYDDPGCNTIFEYSAVKDDKDIIAYLFEKHFNVPYRDTAWHLEKGAKDFVYKIEDDLNHNRIDVREMYERNQDFRNWLVDKHFSDAADQYENDADSCYDYIEFLEFVD